MWVARWSAQPELTAAGTVRDFHPIPFLSHAPDAGAQETFCMAKIITPKEFFSFLQRKNRIVDNFWTMRKISRLKGLYLYWVCYSLSPRYRSVSMLFTSLSPSCGLKLRVGYGRSVVSPESRHLVSSPPYSIQRVQRFSLFAVDLLKVSLRNAILSTVQYYRMISLIVSFP